MACDEGAERDENQRFQMSVLNKSGGSTVPGSCYITEGTMDGMSFHLLTSRDGNLFCDFLQGSEAQKANVVL